MISKPLNQLLYIDIETAPIVNDFLNLPDEFQDIWLRKYSGEESVFTSFVDRAGLIPEFAKIICVSVGYFTNEDGVQKFKVKSIAGEEDVIFAELTQMLKNKKMTLCGHNIKSFDIPFLCKRYVINGLSIPPSINNSGKKPWEIEDVDTMEIWKFGSFQSKNTSLELMTAALGIESPKLDINGSEVGRVYYQEGIARIAEYCNKDVVAVARVTQVLSGILPISDENIIQITKDE